MSAEIRIFTMKKKTKKSDIVIDITSNRWSGLDPSNLGPCLLYKGKTSLSVSDAWNLTKVHKEHTVNGLPDDSYWQWLDSGLNNGKIKLPNSKCLYHLWDGVKYGTIEARKNIYCLLYMREITKTVEYKNLQTIYHENDLIIIKDKNGYDHKHLKMSLLEVLYNENKEMGCSFLLSMLLTKDNALHEIA